MFANRETTSSCDPRRGKRLNQRWEENTGSYGGVRSRRRALPCRLLACSLVGFSQPKPASQQCFPLTINQHQPVQTSPEINQRTGRALIEEGPHTTAKLFLIYPRYCVFYSYIPNTSSYIFLCFSVSLFCHFIPIFFLHFLSFICFAFLRSQLTLNWHNLLASTRLVQMSPPFLLLHSFSSSYLLLRTTSLINTLEHPEKDSIDACSDTVPCFFK